MKKFTFFFVVLFLLSIIGNAQNKYSQEKLEKIKINRTWITYNDGLNMYKGALYEVKDTSIVLSTSLRFQDYKSNELELMNIQLSNIGIIKIRAKDNLTGGIIIGAIAGGLIGYLIGSNSEDDFLFTREQQATMIAFVSAGYGAAAGAILGSIKIKIPIHGNIDKYNGNKARLKKYSIKKNS